MTTPATTDTSAAGTPPTKPPTTATVTWTGDQSFSAMAAGGGTFALDGHSKAAQSPPEALLSALAACTGIDIVEILKKRRTPVERLEIRLSGARAPSVPPRFTAITLDYDIVGAGIDRAAAERAVDLSVTKYCTVKDSMAQDIVFTWRLVLNGERGADHDATAR